MSTFTLSQAITELANEKTLFDARIAAAGGDAATPSGEQLGFLECLDVAAGDTARHV
jgi:hypothetical protein